MPGGLKNSISVWKLARDLALGATDDPIAAVIKFCDKRVKDFLKTFPDCNTLTELLDCVAAKLGTVFEIATRDEDLRQIQQKYVLRGEKIFATLDQELSEDVFAITYRRNNREHWEPEFVSVIDSRGSKAARAYFTKWHELAHLLTLTDQLRLSFRRTHIAKGNAPEEAYEHPPSDNDSEITIACTVQSAGVLASWPTAPTISRRKESMIITQI